MTQSRNPYGHSKHLLHRSKEPVCQRRKYYEEGCVIKFTLRIVNPTRSVVEDANIRVIFKITPVLTIHARKDGDNRTNRSKTEYKDFQETICRSCCDLHDNETRNCIAENCQTNSNPCDTLEKEPMPATAPEQSPMAAEPGDFRGRAGPLSELADVFCSVCRYRNGENYQKCSQRFCVDVQRPYVRRFY